MILTLENYISKRLRKNAEHNDIHSIKRILSRRLQLPEENIGIYHNPGQTLDKLIKFLLEPEDEILAIGPTDKNLRNLSVVRKASYRQYYERTLFIPDPEGIVSRINHRTKIIYLGNPNKYSGVLYSKREIEDILTTKGSFILLLDESSFKFSRISGTDLIDKYDNLMIIRSISNYQYELGNFLIGDSILLGKINWLDSNIYEDTTPAAVIDYLEGEKDRLNRIIAAKEEMLYLSIFLRKFGFDTRLTPDNSIIFMSENSELIFDPLTKSGIRVHDLSCFPDLKNYILLEISFDVDVLSIIGLFESHTEIKGYKKLRRDRITIYRPPERRKMSKSTEISDEKHGRNDKNFVSS